MFMDIIFMVYKFVELCLLIPMQFTIIVRRDRNSQRP